MPGLDPGIHRKNNFYSKVMDCRVKPGNDGGWVNVYEAWYYRASDAAQKSGCSAIGMRQLNKCRLPSAQIFS